jgi:hypothetical protein
MNILCYSVADPNPDSDPLVKGMDPRIWIRLHNKMSWILNTAFLTTFVS